MGAVLGFDVSDNGNYTIAGNFKRGNDLVGQGDGVDAAVVLDADAAHPLWAGHIDSSEESPRLGAGRRRCRQKTGLVLLAGM